MEVRLTQSGEVLVLQVRDNGRGIPPDALTQTKSLGLMGMQERVRMFAGELDIRGAPGQGTTVLVKIPFPAQAT